MRLDTVAPGFDPTLQSIVETLGAGPAVMGGPAGAAFRVQSQDESATGCFEGVTIRPGFSLVLSDLRYTRENVQRYLCGDYLKLHFKLSGTSIIGSDGEEDVAVPAGRLSLLVQPTETVKYERALADSHERSITMICSKDFVSEIVSPSAAELPTSIADFLRARTARFSYSSLPMHPQMRPIVEDLLNPADTGGLGSLMREAKALELLCFAIKQILGTSSTADALRARDRKKIEELCQILEDDTQGGLSIADLSRHLAWNETQMMECFKRVTGTTISNYRHRVRMANALRQLCDTDASITEVAFNAGYEHPSNFATAFKRTFGFSPRLARTRPN